MSGKNIADLLVEAYDGRADIVELKRPGLAFWQAERTTTITFRILTSWPRLSKRKTNQFALEGEIDSIKTRERLKGIPFAKPQSVLIHGRSNDWTDDQFEAQRLLNAGFTNLTVITYDQVLHRAKIIMGRNT